MGDRLRFGSVPQSCDRQKVDRIHLSGGDTPVVRSHSGARRAASMDRTRASPRPGEVGFAIRRPPTLG
jgi:hypothetical protein